MMGLILGWGSLQLWQSLMNELYLNKIWHNRKVKFYINLVIFKHIELKFGIDTNFGPPNSKSSIK